MKLINWVLCLFLEGCYRCLLLIVCLGSIVDVGLRLWPTVATLKENLESLEVAMDQLIEIYEREEQLLRSSRKLPSKKKKRLRRKRKRDVAGWVDRVRRMKAEVIKILQEGKEQKKYAIFSRYKVVKIVSKMLSEVNELRKEGGSLVPFINEKPMEETVGLESMVEELWRCIEDTNLQTIGLYGLGGVGKTTLLKKLNNEFLNRRHEFDAVIWVSVSKQPDLEKIKEKILNYGRWEFKSEEGKAETVYKLAEILKGKKSVLLLDDIWERLDLAVLGVPIQYMHQNGSKVVFTTRSKEICRLMEAQRKIQVECLTAEGALDLFRMEVGEDTLNSHPLISNLAEIMAAECKGLPPALVTVGRAMTSRKNPEEWEHAISILRNSPSQFPGMDNVLLVLKSSFDRLENTTLQSCFLYCSLFPEKYNNRKEELIELWLAEGLLDKFVDSYGDKFSGLSNFRKKGEYIIASLKRACLLESGESEEFVTMHQMIREMALCECRERIKIYVKIGDQSTRAYGSGSWNRTERILLWHCRIEDLAINDTQLPNLLTLICKAPTLTTFPAGFFHLMPALTVLDLSKSSMLDMLPAEIGQLINLQYLNLSKTAISQLPTELANLTKLRCLLLNYLKFNSPMISNFKLLEVFSTEYCKEDLLDKLEHLQHISEISIKVVSSTSVTRLLRSPKLQQCLKKLNFSEDSSLHSAGLSPSFSIKVPPSLLRRMEHLEINCLSLKEFKISQETGSECPYYFDNLCQVVIMNCPISDATWLIYAPRLQNLTLSSCTSMKEVIGGTSDSGVAEIEENANLFSSLTTLHLENLPVLESICRHALPFPFLIKITVHQCLNLKKLPFDSNSAKNSIKKINGARSWWDELQWEDEAIKQVFSSKFVGWNINFSRSLLARQARKNSVWLKGASQSLVEINTWKSNKGKLESMSDDPFGGLSRHSSTKSSLGSARSLSSPSSGYSVPKFSCEELKRATNDFSNLLGRGGFGNVYKGVLPDEKVIVVKQLKSGSVRGEREFRAEVDTIGHICHKNLVSLVGYCIDGNQRMLVYEFVPNNTLDFHLHGKDRPTMKWPTRMKIALNAAEGLTYLHEECQPKIIHRDIKTANILLDNNFVAKVADFGLAKFFLKTYVSTTGYLDLDYATSRKLTDKSDVFSFGVVLLELITGRKPIDETGGSMVQWASPLLKKALKNGNFDGLVDPRLQNKYDSGEMTRMVHCAATCVLGSAQHRPGMNQIILALKGHISLDALDVASRLYDNKKQ